MRIPRLSLRLALAVYTVTSIATATGASAETTANCGGQTTFVNTRQTDCPGQTLYDHLCLGPNGSHGIKNFRLEWGTQFNLYVEQGSTYTYSCGDATYRDDCPANQGCIPLTRGCS
jgi:hypothetical protein